jgi:hypothetical protein
MNIRYKHICKNCNHTEIKFIPKSNDTMYGTTQKLCQQWCNKKHVNVDALTVCSEFKYRVNNELPNELPRDKQLLRK